MEGDMDMDVFNKGDDNEGFEEEETSFIDVDEDFYDNFSRAVASDTLENYDWGNQERYEAARSKYVKEHGASNIPSWTDLSDQVLSPLYYEDPLTTIKGAQERIIELEPNINLDEIEFVKKDGKIYIRSVRKQRGKLGELKPLFTKDGEISADLYRYSWFKEATKNRLQELEELNKMAAAQKRIEDLSEELSVANEKIIKIQAEREKEVEEQRKLRNLSSSRSLDLEDKLFEKAIEIKNLKEKLSILEKNAERLKESKEELSGEDEDKIKILSKQLEDANKEAAEYEKEKIEALQKEAETYEKVDRIEKEKASLLNERNALDADLKVLIKAYKEEEGTSKKLRDEVKREREQYSKLSLRIKDLEDEAENKEVMLERMQKMKENAEKIIAQQKNPTKEQLEELREYREKYHIIKEESERITKELTETRKEYGKIIEEIKKVNSESFKEHEAQIESLKKELKEKEEQLRKTEEALDVEYKKREEQIEIINKYNESDEKIKNLENKIVELKSNEESRLEEIQELKQAIEENDRDYMKQNKLFIDSQRREREDYKSRINKFIKDKTKRNEAMRQARKEIDSLQK